MNRAGGVERLVTLARSLELSQSDLAAALDALEEDLAEGENELKVDEVEQAKTGGLQAELAFLLEHSTGPAEVEKLLRVLAGESAANS